MNEENSEQENLELTPDNSLERNKFVNFLKNIRIEYDTKLRMTQTFFRKIQHANLILQQQLKKTIENDIRIKLELQLKRNNQLLHYLIQLQNMFFNDEKFYEWLELQLGCKNTSTPTPAPKENLTPLEVEAEKARQFPYPTPTPLHFSPLRTNPLS